MFFGTRLFRLYARWIAGKDNKIIDDTHIKCTGWLRAKRLEM